MRILVSVAAAALAIGLAGSAFAAMSGNNITDAYGVDWTSSPQMATGVIKSLNPAKDRITLADGATFDVAKKVNLSSFDVGEKVAITYNEAGKMMDATAIMLVG